MSKCSNCNKEIPDDAQFCDNCGNRITKSEDQTVNHSDIETEVKQKNDQAGAEENQTVNLSDIKTEVKPENNQVDDKKKAQEKTQKKNPASKKKSFLLPVLIGAGALVAVLFAVGAFFMLNSGGRSGKKKEVPRAVYIKDKELYVSDLSKKSPIELTSGLVKGADDIDIMDYVNYNMDFALHFSENGKLVFYPDKFDGESYTLYCKDISKPKKEAIKIDSDISISFPYYVSKNNNIITYIKSGNNAIYQYDMKKKEKKKIDSDIRDYSNMYVDDDGNKIIYVKDDGDLYLKTGGKDKEKIDSDITELVDFDYNDDKITGVIYTKDGKLYKKDEGKEKEKIVSDVDDVISRFKGGSFYFTKEAEDSASVLMDYVEDDMEEHDAAIQEPQNEPQYPSYLSYSSIEEYNKAVEDYNKAVDEYNKAYDEYYEKKQRDTLREELKEEEVSESVKELYYYDGKKETKISDNFISVESRSYKKPVIVFDVADEEEPKKVKLSEIKATYEVYDKLGYDFSSSSESSVIAIGDKVSDIDEEDVKNVEITAEGDMIYFIANVDEDDKIGDLYEINIKDGKASEAKLYDEDIYSEYLRLYESDKVIYFKDYEDKEGTLYINKKEIDDEVYSYKLTYNFTSDSIYYYKDYNDTKNKGSLTLYNGKKTKNIADDVYDFKLLSDGSVLYLYDYSTSKTRGELRHYKNGKDKKIDDDVMAILSYINFNLF